MSNDFLVAGFINKIQYVSFGLLVVGHLNWSMEQIGSPIRYELGKFKHSVGNVHIYNRHLEAFDEVFARKPITDYEFDMKLSGNKNFYDYTIDDFIITTKGTIPKIKSPLPLAI